MSGSTPFKKRGRTKKPERGNPLLRMFGARGPSRRKKVDVLNNMTDDELRAREMERRAGRARRKAEKFAGSDEEYSDDPDFDEPNSDFDEPGGESKSNNSAKLNRQLNQKTEELASMTRSRNEQRSQRVQCERREEACKRREQACQEREAVLEQTVRDLQNAASAAGADEVLRKAFKRLLALTILVGSLPIISIKLSIASHSRSVRSCLIFS